MASANSNMYTSNELIVDEPFVVGDTYLVKWDGTDYECVAKNTPKGIMAYIGSDAFTISPNVNAETSVPFMMSVMPGQNEGEYQLCIRTTDPGETHNVSIRHINVEKKPLDEALLPILYLGEMPISIVDLLIDLASQVLNVSCTREPIDPDLLGQAESTK